MDGSCRDIPSKKTGRALQEWPGVDSHTLRVACHLSELLIQVDKKHNFSANYPKRHGDALFNDYLRTITLGGTSYQHFEYVVAVGRTLPSKERFRFMMPLMKCLPSLINASTLEKRFCSIIYTLHWDLWRLLHNFEWHLLCFLLLLFWCTGSQEIHTS